MYVLGQPALQFYVAAPDGRRTKSVYNVDLIQLRSLKNEMRDGNVGW